MPESLDTPLSSWSNAVPTSSLIDAPAIASTHPFPQAASLSPSASIESPPQPPGLRSQQHTLGDDGFSRSLPLQHSRRLSTPLSRRWSRNSDFTFVSSFPRQRSLSPESEISAASEYDDRQPFMTSNSGSSGKNLYHERFDSLPTYNRPRPLVDLVTNKWQKERDYRDSSFESSDSYSHLMVEKEGFHPPRLPTWILSLHVPRRLQRYLIAYSIFLLACWFGWLYWLQPAWTEEQRLDEGFANASKLGALFGANTRPIFTDMIHLENLDASLLPGAEGTEKRRLIFIGDVHGCPDELSKLLAETKFVPGKDHVIFTGDLIAKGPDSRAVIDIAMKIGASSVRGNHEDRTLLAHHSLAAKDHPLPGPQEDPDSKEDLLDEAFFSHGDSKDHALAKRLSKEHINWLSKCPVILRVGAIKRFNGGGEIVVAHAGLAPGVELERQDPFLVMNMRSINMATRVPSEDRKGEPWEKLWNYQQKHTHPSSERATVIYGHDSKRGLNIEKYSKGLDSGCVRGGSLTAFIIDHRGRQKTVSVQCKVYRE